MELGDYQLAVADVRFGKRVGTSLYFHKICAESLPNVLAEFTENVSRVAAEADFEFDVYKLDVRTPIISLLQYPAFFDDAFPTLAKSAIWSESDGRLNVRIYQNPEARPVLHRKELLLPFEHERSDEFAALTEMSEMVGLFADPSRIGRHGYWTSLLAAKEISVVGHSLYRSEGRPVETPSQEVDVPRYKTALKRNRLSVPIQLLYKHELLNDGGTVFDYGCGRGDDVRLLRDLGVQASGWDPHYLPNEEIVRADIVNLGYVVNVI